MSSLRSQKQGEQSGSLRARKGRLMMPNVSCTLHNSFSFVIGMVRWMGGWIFDLHRLWQRMEVSKWMAHYWDFQETLCIYTCLAFFLSWSPALFLIDVLERLQSCSLISLGPILLYTVPSVYDWSQDWRMSLIHQFSIVSAVKRCCDSKV